VSGARSATGEGLSAETLMRDGNCEALLLNFEGCSSSYNYLFEDITVRHFNVCSKCCTGQVTSRRNNLRFEVLMVMCQDYSLLGCEGM
jgi:hypothetical protein